jgi:predicted nucleic acid-binding protein
MSVYIVDASVGIKWFVPEIDADIAQRLQTPTHQILVPTFFDVEVANIVWKKRRRGELSRPEADAILAQLPALPITRHAELPLLGSAFDIADQCQRTVYDCLYLALAVREGGMHVSADERFVNSLAGTPWAAFVLALKSLP